MAGSQTIGIAAGCNVFERCVPKPACRQLERFAGFPILLEVHPNHIARQIVLTGKLNDKLGVVLKSETVRSHYSAMTSGTTGVVVKETTFADGKGTETFTFRMEGDKALLLGYHIDSMDLLTK